MKIQLFKVYILLLLFLATLHADSCWSQRSKSQVSFDELNSIVSVSIRDATNCNELKNATMKINDKTLTSNEEGVFQIPLREFENMKSEDIPILIHKEGYIPIETTLTVRLGLVWNKFFLLSKELKPTSVRVVLEWGNKPEDIDLHLISEEFHISFQNMKNFQNKAILDIDARNGYGPETITLDLVERNKTYKFYVENYSKEAMFDGTAKVTIYADNKQQRIINIPKTSDYIYELFEIRNSKLVYK